MPNGSASLRGRALSRAEIGCFLSHYGTWERIVEAEIPCAVVLEDDARLEEGFRKVAAETVEHHAEWGCGVSRPYEETAAHSS